MNSVQIAAGVTFVSFCVFLGLFVGVTRHTDLGRRCHDFFSRTLLGVWGYHLFRYLLLLVGILSLLAYIGVMTSMH